VKINEGPFQDFLGKVDEVNDDQGKVRVLVSFFGKETPVELDFIQISGL
jgi:transcriptional antiterminator NusG